MSSQLVYWEAVYLASPESDTVACATVRFLVFCLSAKVVYNGHQDMLAL